MNPPTKPGASCSTKDSTVTHVPETSGNNHPATHLRTPNPTHSVFPTRVPRKTGSAAMKACTVDKSLFGKIAVHTAKCTECDKRNMNIMLRCPGCTFQVCQPCHEKRQLEGKGLLHGNMPSTEAITTVIPNGNGVGAATKQPEAGAAHGESDLKKSGDPIQKQDVGDTATKKDCSSTVPKSAPRKRMTTKPQREDDNEHDGSYKEDSEPSDTSQLPNKRRRTDLSFAESAFATALRAPPTTRAASRSELAATNGTFSSLPLATVGLARYPAPENPLGEYLERDDILYQHAIKNYHEPLLGRREPVLSNPVAHIPAIVRHGGRPRPSAQQIYQNIQNKVREKLNMLKDPTVAPEQARSETAMQSNAEQSGDHPYTVRVCMQEEAEKYRKDAALDEDDGEALFNTMHRAAIIWGRHTHSELDPETQRVLRPGLSLRLDSIDSAYTAELKSFMAEQAAQTLKELGRAGVPGSEFALRPSA